MGRRGKFMLDPTQHMQPPRGCLPAEWFNGMDAESNDNAELAAMFREDQLDRGVGQPDSWPGIDWNAVGPRDDARRIRVREILDGGGACSALDYYHCSFMMHHSAHLEEYKLANALALAALELDPDSHDIRWLFAAAKDRMLIAMELPQVFGLHVQFKRGSGGPDTNEWWFKTGLTLDDRQTDALRVQWGLKELSARKGSRRKDRELPPPPQPRSRSSGSSRPRPWQQVRAALPIVAVKAKAKPKVVEAQTNKRAGSRTCESAKHDPNP